MSPNLLLSKQLRGFGRPARSMPLLSADFGCSEVHANQEATMKALRRHLNAAALGSLALIMSSVPLSAQRNRPNRQARPTRVAEVGVAVRTDFGAFAVTNRGVTFRAPRVRARLMLRGLRVQNPRAFRRLLRDHNRLHRDMRHLRGRRAERAHRRWHNRVGFGHGEFVRFESRERRQRRSRW
jgi:hypothetical protein